MTWSSVGCCSSRPPWPSRRSTPGPAGDDRAFYEGKVAVASFFAKNFLPLLTSTRQVIDTLDNEVMELDEAAF